MFQAFHLTTAKIFRTCCRIWGLILIGFVLLHPVESLANDSFPSKPIKVIVPLGAGGGTDVVVRIVMRHLQDELKQSIVIENIVGVGGVIGTNAAAKAAPDGYTLVWGANTTLASTPFLFKSVRFNPVNDFVPVAMLGGVDTALIVPTSLGVKNLVEFVKLAKENPGKLSYGSGSTNAFLSVELLKMMAGIDVVRVNYKSTPQSLIDLAEGRLQLLSEPIATSAAFVKAGKVRVIAINSKARLRELPDVPTSSEQGVPLFRFGWGGFYAPAKTPQSVVDVLAQALQNVMKRPDVQAKIMEQGWVPSVAGPQEMTEILKLELASIGKVVRAAKIEPE